MAPGELEAVADEGYELTEIARQTLKAEIAGRGLSITIRDVRPPHADPDLDLVHFDQVVDLGEAMRIKGVLDAAGIPSYWGPDRIEDVETLRSSFDLEVRFVDYEKALAALGQNSSPAEEPLDEAGSVARCPKCHCPDIVFQGLEASDTGSTFNWTCDECGHQWKDDGVELA